MKAAQAAGAKAVVVLQTSTTAGEAFSPDGDPAGVSIPVAMIDKKDGDAMRSTLCPKLENGKCSGGESINATLRDSKGEWGAFRVVDMSNPAEPHEIGLYRPPRANIFPPTDLSVLSPQRAAVHGNFAIVPWNSDGARMIDLASGAPKEVASFVPPDVADPTGVLPTKAFVVSIGLLSLPASGATGARDYVLVSDINSGLYVLRANWGETSTRLSSR